MIGIECYYLSSTMEQETLDKETLWVLMIRGTLEEERRGIKTKENRNCSFGKLEVPSSKYNGLVGAT